MLKEIDSTAVVNRVCELTKDPKGGKIVSPGFLWSDNCFPPAQLTAPSQFMNALKNNVLIRLLFDQYRVYNSQTLRDLGSIAGADVNVLGWCMDWTGYNDKSQVGDVISDAYKIAVKEVEAKQAQAAPMGGFLKNLGKKGGGGPGFP